MFSAKIKSFITQHSPRAVPQCLMLSACNFVDSRTCMCFISADGTSPDSACSIAWHKITDDFDSIEVFFNAYELLDRMLVLESTWDDHMIPFFQVRLGIEDGDDAVEDAKAQLVMTRMQIRKSMQNKFVSALPPVAEEPLVA